MTQYCDLINITENKLIRKRRLLLLSDYDGTIVPIAPSPDKAAISAETKNLLSGINNLPGVSVGIISGRSLSDLKKMCAVPGIIYAGNHGIEWEINGIKGRLKSVKNSVRELSKIKKQLNVMAGKFKGLMLEDKMYMLSVHYRLIDKNLHNSFKKYLRYLITPYRKSRSITMTRGKMVYEIKLDLHWDKGDFAEFLQENYFPGSKRMTVYLGDDVTDEDVFVKLPDAMTIKVGRQKTKAKYYLNNPREVTAFLRILFQIRSAK